MRLISASQARPGKLCFPVSSTRNANNYTKRHHEEQNSSGLSHSGKKRGAFFTLPHAVNNSALPAVHRCWPLWGAPLKVGCFLEVSRTPQQLFMVQTRGAKHPSFSGASGNPSHLGPDGKENGLVLPLLPPPSHANAPWPPSHVSATPYPGSRLEPAFLGHSEPSSPSRGKQLCCSQNTTLKHPQYTTAMNVVVPS